MAKRKKKKYQQKKKMIRAKQQASKPKELLNQAVNQFNSGQFGEAADLAQTALSKQKSPELESRTIKILVESLFRAAAQADSANDRLSYLDSALDYAADDGRLHFHKGTSLLRQGKPKPALASLDQAAHLGYIHPQLSYLRAIARLSSGTTLDPDELPAAQAGMLQILDGVNQKRDVDELLALVDTHLPADQKQLWRSLVKMADSKSAVPIKAMQKASEAVSPDASPLATYYLGVAAMRNKETDVARSAWSSISGLDSPWFTANVGNLFGEQILELGREEAWNKVLAKLPELEGLPSVQSNKAVQELIGIAHFHEGNRLVESQEWFGAIAAWEKASDHISNRLLLQNLALAQEATEELSEAAESWRAMIKRRPRKKDHPDYLSEEQVAAVWSRAAACYVFAGDLDEAIPCLKNAIKYDEGNIKTRLALVDAYMEDFRIEAAINEANRILEIDEKNIPALEYLGALYAEDQWRYDTTDIWRRILAIDPSHQEAQDSLAQNYIDRASFGSNPLLRFRDGLPSLASLRRQINLNPIDMLKKGLEELPNHPMLLLHIGEHLSMEYEDEEARDYFYKAWQAKPGDLKLTAMVITAMLQADGGDLIREILPQVKQMHQPISAFWMSLVKVSIDSEQELEWIEFFIDEAIEATKSSGENTHRLEILLEVFDYMMNEDEIDLGKQIADRIRQEEPNEGGPEYADSCMALNMDGDHKKALKLIRKSISKMRKAGHEKLVAQASMIESMLSGEGHPFQGVEQELARFGFDLDGPPPSPEDFMEFLENADEETVNALRQLIGF